MNTERNFLKATLTAIMVLFLASFVFAQEQKTKVKTTSTMKEIEGEIGGITKRSISLIISRDEEKGEETEMLLPFVKEGIKLEHKKNLSEIAPGDRVRIQYEVVTNEDEQGNIKTDSKVKVISFIAAKKNKGQALISEEPLTLKGTK